MSREDQAKETRRRIVGAARDLLDVLPYEEITIDEVSRRAEIGRTTFYLHFESKAELYREISTAATSGLIELTGRFAALDPSDSDSIARYVDECERSFLACARYLEISANVIDPRELAEWAARVDLENARKSIAALAANGIEPSADAEAELTLGTSMLIQQMLNHALGSEPARGWKQSLAAHLRLALERARAAPSG